MEILEYVSSAVVAADTDVHVVVEVVVGDNMAAGNGVFVYHI